MIHRRSAFHTGIVAGTLAVALGVSACSGTLATTDKEVAAETGGTLKIGLLSTTDGALAVLGEAANRGAKLALLEYGGKLDGSGPRDGVSGATVGGKKIELDIDSSDGSPDTAVAAATRLVENKGDNVLVGPLSGDEGLAVKDFAKSHPDITFVNGSSGAQNATLRNPVANFFRFNTDGAQWMAGLGTYVADTLDYKSVATLGEDYSFPYDQVGGFMTEFCSSGGKVPAKIWVPLGTKDYASYISQIPSGIDAIYVALAGSDALNFTKQLDESSNKGLKIIGGSVTVDSSLISGLGKRADGIVAAGPVAVLDTPEYKAYAAAYTKNFPDAGAPGLFDVAYYVAMKSVLKGLASTKGDVSGSESALKKALTTLTWTTPTGPVKLDDNRQAVANNYVFKVEDGAAKVIETKTDVTQTLGFPVADYVAKPAFDRDNPSCK